MTDFETHLVAVLTEIRDEIQKLREQQSQQAQQAMFEAVMEEISSQQQGILVPRHVADPRHPGGI